MRQTVLLADAFSGHESAEILPPSTVGTPLKPGAFRVKWAVGALLVGGALVLWWTGLLAEVADAQRIQSGVREAGPAGPVFFVGLVFVLQPFFLAGPPIWLSSSLWSLPLAILYSGIAGVVASVPYFYFARHWGRSWAQSRISPSVRRWEDRMEKRPLLTILALRLLLWINPAVDLFAGVSRIATRDYVLGTVLGLIPPTIVQVLIGAQLVVWSSEAPSWFWPAIAAGVVAFFVIRALRRGARGEGEAEAP